MAVEGHQVRCSGDYWDSGSDRVGAGCQLWEKTYRLKCHISNLTVLFIGGDIAKCYLQCTFTST